MTRGRGRLLRTGAVPLAAATVAAILALAATAVALSVGLIGTARTSRASLPQTGSDARCTTQVSSLAAAARAVAQARAGSTICLVAGTYEETLSLAARHDRYVTLRAAPDAHVQLGTVRIAGSHIALRDLWVQGEIALAAGSSFVLIDHDDITNAGHHGGEGIVFDTSDCTVPNAPTWPGCEPQAPIADVTISHNHIHDIGQAGGEDAIHLDNWRRVRITGNELDHIIENGEHTDCMQSVYGGDQLTFDHNYEHDNDCQGFFVKDGDATNVTVAENLFLRDQIGAYANFAQIWNVRGLTVQHNTIWDGKGLALVADQASFTPTATIDHNLIDVFTIERPVGTPYSVTERRNIFGESPWSFGASVTDRAASRPRFHDPARDDYRLARNPHHIGIDWSPAAQSYGPPR
jgi:Right handed beta helix region